MIDLLAATTALLVLDQWSKWMVRLHISHSVVNFGRALRIRQVISAKPIYTQDGSRAGLVLIWFVALASATTLHLSGTTFQSRMSMLGAGAALGGAAGNLLDIVRQRSVLDFIDLGWWPVFNVADLGIVVGLLLAFWPVV